MITPLRRAVSVAMAVPVLIGMQSPMTSSAPMASAADPAIAAWDSLSCGPAAASPVLDSKPTVVSMPPASLTIGSLPASIWAAPPTTNPTWQLRFYGFSWMKPSARRAHEDGQTKALGRMVDQIEAFYRQNPDRGRSTLGWDEGSSLRRLENLTCLYTLTKDKRLETRMSQEVSLLFGPRYAGPPLRPVHNHGLMANVFIIRAGMVTDRQAWVDRAVTRMRHEADLAFSRKGTSMEQSAMYHNVNRDMWADASRYLIGAAKEDASVARLRATIDHATVVGRWLTEPDGRIVQIGDSSLLNGIAPRGGEKPGVFQDDETGFLIGRYSWTDRSTTYYTVRYGPARWAHGHHDKGSVTWSTAGKRVLADAGYFSYDWTDPMAVRARSIQAHNTAWPLTGRFSERATASLRKAPTRAGQQAWVVSDKAYGVPHTRTVTVNHASRGIAIKDVYGKGVRLNQAWHLAPEWTYRGRSGGQLRFTTADGRQLFLVTNGVLSSLKRGQVKPPSGWTHPHTNEARPNWEVVLKGTTSISTTFQVR